MNAGHFNIHPITISKNIEKRHLGQAMRKLQTKSEHPTRLGSTCKFTYIVGGLAEINLSPGASAGFQPGEGNLKIQGGASKSMYIFRYIYLYFSFI